MTSPTATFSRVLDMALEGLSLAAEHAPADIKNQLQDYIVHVGGALADGHGGNRGRVVTAKARYRLVTTTNLYYHFVNVHSSGIQREHYTIRRADFWGRAR